MNSLFWSVVGALLALTHAEFIYGQSNSTVAKCTSQGSCTVSGTSGTCVSISAGCCDDGTVTSGLCPGSSDIMCCTAGKPSGSFGVDVCESITTSAASCFKSAGLTYVVPRGYRSTGAVDTLVCTSLKNAAIAGIETRDVYMFPCPTCSASASAQMSQLVTYLNSNCKSYFSGRVWLDIEGSEYWYSSTSTNKAWFEALKDSCSTYGVTCGVYSSSSQWSSIFGSTSYSYGSDLPLWYAHYDNSATFSDFSAFGGWKTPHAKQYAGDVTQCSIGVDKNWAESTF